MNINQTTSLNYSSYQISIQNKWTKLLTLRPDLNKDMVIERINEKISSSNWSCYHYLNYLIRRAQMGSVMPWE